MTPRSITTAEDAVKMTASDVEKVVEALGDSPTGQRNRALVLLMADSALRCAEALALSTGDVVREAGQVKHLIVRKGKGGKRAKQKVTNRTALALARWEATRAKLGIVGDVLFCTISKGQGTGYGAGRTKNEYRLTPGRALSGAYVRQFVKAAGMAAGLDVDLHPHLLRHWSITRFLRTNGDLELTRKFARHSDVTTTARVYSHLTQDDVDAGLERVEQVAAKQEEAPDVLAGMTAAQLDLLVVALQKEVVRRGGA